MNYQSLIDQGMALRDEIRNTVCWKSEDEFNEIRDRVSRFAKRMAALETADPEIRNSGGGWRHERLDTVHTEQVNALFALLRRRCEPPPQKALKEPHGAKEDDPTYMENYSPPPKPDGANKKGDTSPGEGMTPPPAGPEDDAPPRSPDVPKPPDAPH